MRNHGLEVIASIEAILELGQAAWGMLPANGMVSGHDGVLDVTQQRVDPVELGVLHAGTPTAGCCGDHGGRWGCTHDGAAIGGTLLLFLTMMESLRPAPRL